MRAALLLAALILRPAVAAGADAAPSGRVRIAVAGVAANGIPARLAAAVAGAMTDAAAEAGAEVVAPAEVARAVPPGAGDAVSCAGVPACAVEAGRALGVGYLLAGTVTAAGTGWRIDVRVVDAKRGRVGGQATDSVGRDDSLAGAAAARATRRLVQMLQFQAQGVLPPPPSALPATAPGAAADEAAGAGRPAASARRRWGLAIGGTGVALLVGSAATGLLALSTASEARTGLATGNLGQFAASQRTSRLLAVSSAALAGAGAIATGTGGWLYFGTPRRQVTGGVELVAGGAIARGGFEF